MLAHHSVAGIALSVTLILLVVPAALIDLEHRIIPNRITALGAVLALALGLALDPAGEPERLIAGAAAGGFLLLAALAYPGGMGMGDVKLAAVMGLFLGSAVAPAILIALLAGVLARRRRDRPQGRARGPQDGDPVRPLPRAGGARGGVRRAGHRRVLRQSLPALKRRRLRADTPRAGDSALSLKRSYADASFPEHSTSAAAAASDVVGLDIQPGLVAAVQARVNGSVVVERAAGAPLPADTVREGEVVDEGALAETLRELFKDGGLSKRVRLGVANQRTVLRTLELPPVTDRKELAAAVRFQAQDQVPMPLSNAVLDFHPLGIVDTPAGPRQRVVLVAAQRDMIERLLAAVRDAGLRPEGMDLSAFALIRSLYRPDPEHAGRVLYLNVDGLTNLAIAEGTICRFTRVVGGGIEAMAGELAERRSIALVDARALLAAVDLTVPAERPSSAAGAGADPERASRTRRG